MRNFEADLNLCVAAGAFKAKEWAKMEAWAKFLYEAAEGWPAAIKEVLRLRGLLEEKEKESTVLRLANSVLERRNAELEWMFQQNPITYSGGATEADHV